MCPPIGKVRIKLKATRTCDVGETHTVADAVIEGDEFSDIFRRVKEFQQKHRYAQITFDGYILADPQGWNPSVKITPYSP